MQHTLNSICMTGWVFFFLPREAFYKVCQVAAVRAEVAFPSVMLTAAVPAQAEWNGNDIMFIQERRFPGPDQCQQDSGMQGMNTRSRPSVSGAPLLLHT